MNTLNKGDFILVQIGGKHWVGYICKKISSVAVETRFIRRKNTKDSSIMQFVYPDKDDIFKQPASAIKCVLPKPRTNVSGTGRTAAKIIFDAEKFNGFAPICLIYDFQ